MTVLQLSALALSTLGAAEAPEANATGGWQGLDHEIESLASSLGTQDGGVDISGYLRARFTYSSDAMTDPDGDPNTSDGEDWSSFQIVNARLNFTGSVGDYGFKIQTDFGDAGSVGTDILKDAKVWWNCSEYFKVTFGQYKIPFSRSFMVSTENLMFLNRTMAASGGYPLYIANTGDDTSWGASYARRDQGIMGSGDYERFKYWLSIQNGMDEAGANYRWTARAEMDFFGGNTTNYEGGYGLSDESALSVGLAYTNDTGDFTTGSPNATGDGDAVTVDGVFQMNPFTVRGAVYFNGDAIGDNTPWNLGGSWMFTPEWEVALRYEDNDVPSGALEVPKSALTAGINWYLYGPDSKWQLNLINYDSNQDNPKTDDDALDGLVLVLGLTLGF